MAPAAIPPPASPGWPPSKRGRTVGSWRRTPLPVALQRRRVMGQCHARQGELSSGVVADALDFARALWQALPDAAADWRLVGGLAVRAHLGSLARQSLDLDLAVMTEASRDALLEYLTQLGFVVGRSGGWWRATDRSPSGWIVDVTPVPVVNPRTLEVVSLGLRALKVDWGASQLTAVGLEDLVVLKLLAGRDQDLVDLLLLTAHTKPSTVEIVSHLERDDLERTASSTATEARQAIAQGYLVASAEALLGRPVEAGEISRFVEFLAQLERRGI